MGDMKRESGPSLSLSNSQTVGGRASCATYSVWYMQSTRLKFNDSDTRKYGNQTSRKPLERVQQSKRGGV